MNLASCEVHLWSQSLEVPIDQVESFFNLLSEEERLRAARFHFERHRHHFIVARGRLREILATYLSQQPQQIVFAYRKMGKPDIAGNASGLQFNLSHSGDIAVYAFTRAREIGVDIEEVRADFAREQIPERFFSPGEVRALRDLPRALQPRGFFECWTRKEAYLKARAEGLTIPLNSFDVSLGIPARFLRNGEGWTLRSFDITPGYVGAVAAAGEDWVITHTHHSPSSDYAIILR